MDSIQACNSTMTEQCTSTNQYPDELLDNNAYELHFTMLEWIENVYPDLAIKVYHNPGVTMHWHRFCNINFMDTMVPRLPPLELIRYDDTTKKLSIAKETHDYSAGLPSIITNIWINTYLLPDIIKSLQGEQDAMKRNLLFSFLKDMHHNHVNCVFLLRAVREYLLSLSDRIENNKIKTHPLSNQIMFDMQTDSVIYYVGGHIYLEIVQDIENLIASTARTIEGIGHGLRLLDGAIYVDDMEIWNDNYIETYVTKEQKIDEQKIYERNFNDHSKLEQFQKIIDANDKKILFVIDMLGQENAVELIILRDELMELCDLFLKESNNRIGTSDTVQPSKYVEPIGEKLGQIKNILIEYDIEL
jgi:hypothetical protein